MFKTGLSEVKPDFASPHPASKDHGTPNISKLRRLMHLAQKEPVKGPKIVYGDNEQEESLSLARSSKRRRSVEVPPSTDSVAEGDLDDNEP